MAKLRDYFACHHVLPPFATVTTLLGFRSTGSVAAMVQRMKRDGFIELFPDRRLQPRPRFFECSVAHSVQAGSPQPANDLVPVGYDIMQRLVRVPSKTALLRVRGESMIDAGIMHGDYVVVHYELRQSSGTAWLLPVHCQRSEYTDNLLWQDFSALLDKRERHIVVCLRKGTTNLGDIGTSLVYANHSPISKALVRIRKKTLEFLSRN